VRLPYEGDNLAMYVVLPDAHTTPATILGILGGDNWRRITQSGFSSRNVNLVLPKFRIEYGVDLGQALQALGMHAAFSASGANFPGIAPGVFVSAVRHKTFVETNEEGTEAAAVTLGAKTLGVPIVVDMIVDRPFLFLIQDKQTEMILFMGVVFDPAAGNSIERLH
jgi:serine protease inhibitor